jgi:hypothetical protein
LRRLVSQSISTGLWSRRGRNTGITVSTCVSATEHPTVPQVVKSSFAGRNFLGSVATNTSIHSHAWSNRGGPRARQSCSFFLTVMRWLDAQPASCSPRDRGFDVRPSPQMYIPSQELLDVNADFGIVTPRLMAMPRILKPQERFDCTRASISWHLFA